MSITPQAAVVLAHLQAAGSITAVEAQACHKVRHLPARIFELRRAGVPIRSETRRDCARQRYVRYLLQIKD